MASVWELLLMPFVAFWRLVKLLALPAMLTAAAWWLFGTGSTVFTVVTLVCVCWVLVALYLWRLQIHGRLRSMERGAIRVREGGR